MIARSKNPLEISEASLIIVAGSLGLVATNAPGSLVFTDFKRARWFVAAISSATVMGIAGLEDDGNDDDDDDATTLRLRGLEESPLTGLNLDN